MSPSSRQLTVRLLRQPRSGTSGAEAAGPTLEALELGSASFQLCELPAGGARVLQPVTAASDPAASAAVIVTLELLALNGDYVEDNSAENVIDSGPAEAGNARLTEAAAEAENARLTEAAAVAENARLTEAAAEAENARLTEAAAEAENARLTEAAAEAEHVLPANASKSEDDVDADAYEIDHTLSPASEHAALVSLYGSPTRASNLSRVVTEFMQPLESTSPSHPADAKPGNCPADASNAPVAAPWRKSDYSYVKQFSNQGAMNFQMSYKKRKVSRGRSMIERIGRVLMRSDDPATHDTRRKW